MRKVAVLSIVAAVALLLGACATDPAPTAAPQSVAESAPVTETPNPIPTQASSLPSFPRVELSKECSNEMWSAAQIPTSQNNDYALVVAMENCASLDMWVTALRANPDAIGLTGLSQTELVAVIDATCLAACQLSTCDVPPCVDARSRGIL